MAGDGYRVGVMGATGAVGSTILSLLHERGFPAREVVAYASERSAGKEIEWGGGTLTVQPLDDETIQSVDVVLSSPGGAVSAEWSPRFVEAGATVVDNTSYWRMHDDVPLVVAGVNDEAAEAHQGIVANPNCTTMTALMALAPIHRAAGLERLIVSSYQAVSGTGQKAIEELRAQARAILADEEMPAPAVYPRQIAFNVLPQVETFKDGDDYTTEERKVMAETRKILGFGEEVGISATCARVPVFVGHSESINLQTREDLSPEDCRVLLGESVGVQVVDNPADAEYPLAIDAAGQDDVLVGRIRRDPGHERTLNLWVAGDNLRKGAATNAVQVAEILVDRGWLLNQR
ncbi:MAG TPA: aspartate-semialdehyde dehydrogenase [Solirubrobacterales bacterium]|jgi:aspartate-semialdehyde dehydrogenase|nr:aspartate-semialdehyde dehydrogenase [Solirubrobacterales bacterium]